MEYRRLIPWAKKLTILLAAVALMWSVYIFGMSTPATGDSNRVVYVPNNWSLKPAGIDPGERFRLIFLSSTKRDATSTDIETYNTFV